MSSYNNYEDTVRADNERRQRAKMLKRRRAKRIKIIKRRIGAAVVVAGIGIIAVVATHINAKYKDSTITQNETIEVAADNYSADDNIQENKKVNEYATISPSYVEVTSEQVKSPNVALLDVDNNQIIAGRNADIKIYPASMTKVMTLIVAVENLKDTNATLTFTNAMLYDFYRENATVAGFLDNETVDVEDMLYGLILPSGADAALGLAMLTSGSEEAFVELMNQKCTELGLKNTHFVNTSGLHDPEHYTTPIEMAMIMKYAMSIPECAKVLSTYQYTTKATQQHPEGILLTSTMFSRMYGNEVEGVTIKAGKTGYTSEALQCLVSYAVKGEHSYIAVTTGSTNKWHSIFDDFEIYKTYLP